MVIRASAILLAGVALLGALAAPPAMAVSPGPHTRVFTRATPQGEVRIAAEVMGSGPLVVLIPSLGRGAHDFDELVVQLADAGFTAAAIDPRGVGQSRGPGEGLTLFDYAEDAVMVARGLSDKPAVFVGHAFGNRVARAAAAAHPERVSRLVLLAAGGQVPIAPPVQAALGEVFQGLPHDRHMAAVRLAFFAPGNDPAVWQGGWYPDLARQEQSALAATRPEQWTGAGEATPILVVQAEDDAVAPPANAEALVKAYPDRVKVTVLPRAGHAMLPERPAAVGDIVVTYLKTGEAPARYDR